MAPEVPRRRAPHRWTVRRRTSGGTGVRARHAATELAELQRDTLDAVARGFAQARTTRGAARPAPPVGSARAVEDGLSTCAQALRILAELARDAIRAP